MQVETPVFAKEQHPKSKLWIVVADGEDTLRKDLTKVPDSELARHLDEWAQ